MLLRPLQQLANVRPRARYCIFVLYINWGCRDLLLLDIRMGPLDGGTICSFHFQIGQRIFALATRVSCHQIFGYFLDRFPFSAGFRGSACKQLFGGSSVALVLSSHCCGRRLLPVLYALFFSTGVPCTARSLLAGPKTSHSRPG